MTGDSLFNEHLRDAVERSASEGGIGPFSDRGTLDSTRLVIHLTSDLPTSGDTTAYAVWPLFRLQVPVERPAAPWKGPRVSYPVESVYAEFITAVRRGIARATDRPAEMMGCRVPQLVQQPFVFGFR